MKKSSLVLTILIGTVISTSFSHADIVIRNALLQLSPHQPAVPVQIPVIRDSDFTPIGDCRAGSITVQYRPFQNNKIQIGSEIYDIEEGTEYNSHVIRTNGCQLEEAEFRVITFKVSHHLFPAYKMGFQIHLTDNTLEVYSRSPEFEHHGVGTFQR